MLRRLALIAAAFVLAPCARGATHWNVTDTGAVADGKTDCTAAFQKALDAAGKAGGGVVDVPAGYFRIDGTLSIPAAVTLQGTFRMAPAIHWNPKKQLDGTVLLAYAGRGKPDGPPFISLAESNAVLAGVTVYYPEWKQSDVPPVPYPPCVESHDTENVGVLDCLLINPYEAIKLVRAHRHLVRNVTGYPSWRGIYVDQCYDIGHIENIHFWPFGVSYDPNNPYCKWVNTHAVAFELARTDWHYVSNTFCFGYGIGYRFSQSKAGATNGNFLGLGADCCRRAVYVESTQAPGLLITNGEFVGRWSSEDSVTVEIGPRAEGKVSLVNCSFWGPIDRCIWSRSPSCQVTASACNFCDWDNHGSGSPAIQLDAGRAIVEGCTFNRDKLDVRVAADVTSAILTGNQAAGGFRLENHAGAHAIAGLNERDPVQWTPSARACYHVTVGAPGDGRYLNGFYNPEVDKTPFRWSMASSQLVLPVTPRRAYTVTLDIANRKEADAPDAGLYLGETRIGVLKPDASAIVAKLPPQRTDRVTLVLRVHGWVPKQVEPGSNDERTLGVQLHGVTVRAAGVPASGKPFNANTGR